MKGRLLATWLDPAFLVPQEPSGFFDLLVPTFFLSHCDPIAGLGFRFSSEGVTGVGVGTEGVTLDILTEPNHNGCQKRFKTILCLNQRDTLTNLNILIAILISQNISQLKHHTIAIPLLAKRCSKFFICRLGETGFWDGFPRCVFSPAIPRSWLEWFLLEAFGSQVQPGCGISWDGPQSLNYKFLFIIKRLFGISGNQAVVGVLSPRGLPPQESILLFSSSARGKKASKKRF